LPSGISSVSVGADVDGLACFLHCPISCSWQTWVPYFLTGAALSDHDAMADGTFLGCEAPGLDIYRGVNRLGPRWTSSFMEKPAFYRGTLVQRQSYHGDYVCPRGGAIVSVSDGIDSSTRVPATMGAWVPIVQSYHARHSMMLPFMGLALLAFPDAESP
jgi:hypothetical protein